MLGYLMEFVENMRLLLFRNADSSIPNSERDNIITLRLLNLDTN
jgi:hypothetical protein